MNEKSVFKIAVLFITYFKLFVVSLPFSVALVNLKQGKFQYGYDFFELNFNTAILVSVAIAIVLGTWNAFEHSDRKDMDEAQFMKANQRYQLVEGQKLSQAEISERLKPFVAGQRRWKWRKGEAGNAPFVLEVKNKVGAKDVVKIEQVADGWIISSKPKYLIDFIDLARNFENVKSISKVLKKA